MQCNQPSRWLRVLCGAALLMILAACQPIRPLTEQAAAATVEKAQPAQPEQSTKSDTSNTSDASDTSNKSDATTPATSTGDSEKAAQLIQEGHDLLVQSDLVGAEDAYQAAIEADPQNIEAHNGLADVYLYQPQYHQQALEISEAAAEIAPEDAGVLARLSWAYQGKHRFEEARTTAEKAIELDPDSSIAHVALADVLSAMYEIEPAYEAAQKAVELDDQSATAWVTLGSIAFTLEKWKEAGDDYARALDLEPDFFLWQIFQARYELDTTGDLDAASSIAEPAIESQPDHAYVLSFQVDIASEKNDWKAAEQGCTQQIELNTARTAYPDGYTCMVALKLLREDYAGAEKFQKDAEKVAWPERRDITVFRMRLLNDKDKCDEGRKLAEEWLKDRPYSVAAMRMIGSGYMCAENYDKAIEYFKKTVDKLPLSLFDARLLANAYARASKETDAVNTLNKFRSLSVRNPLYYQALYEVYLFVGKSRDAVKQAQRWQVLRPESSDAKVNLAWAFLMDGKIDAAQSAAQEAMDSGYDDSFVNAILGETYTLQGNFEKGEELLKKSLERNDDNFLAHSYLTTLYLSQQDCEKALPHLEWMQKKTKEQEQLDQLKQLIEACSSGGLGVPGQDTGKSDEGSQSGAAPRSSADERNAVSTVRTFLRDNNVRIRTVKFSGEEKQRALEITYSSRATAGSKEFKDQERKIIFGLASLVPDMKAQPAEVVIISQANDKPQTRVTLSSEAATLWMEGRITDEEFEDSWKVETAE